MDYINDPLDIELGPQYNWFCINKEHEYCDGYNCDCDCHEEIIDE
jgi:hypothetical protein